MGTIGSAANGSVMAYDGSSVSWTDRSAEPSVDMRRFLPRLLEALGLGPGDRLVVRGVDGERELHLDCLDEDVVREVLES